MTLTAERKLPWDWFDGAVPANVELDQQSYLETSYSLELYRSRAEVGLRIGAGACAYTGTMFDAGPHGRLSIGRCTMINNARIVCDDRVDIGDYVLISWNAVIMDSYRAATDPLLRRAHLKRTLMGGFETGEASEARPVRIGNNAWIGFDAIVLPGVTVGDGSIVGARSVVTEDVPPFSVAAGNPARIVRALQPCEVPRGC